MTHGVVIRVLSVVGFLMTACGEPRPITATPALTPEETPGEKSAPTSISIGNANIANAVFTPTAEPTASPTSTPSIAPTPSPSSCPTTPDPNRWIPEPHYPPIASRAGNPLQLLWWSGMEVGAWPDRTRRLDSGLRRNDDARVQQWIFS